MLQPVVLGRDGSMWRLEPTMSACNSRSERVECKANAKILHAGAVHFIKNSPDELFQSMDLLQTLVDSIYGFDFRPCFTDGVARITNEREDIYPLLLWRRGIQWKCHPSVDLHSGQLDTWTTGLGSEKRTTVTQERWKGEILCWCSMCCEAQGET